MERLIRRTTAQQVADQLEISILAGEFEAGGRLPPERKLAAMLGVSRLTLREGISRLVARGLLIAVPGLGTYVSSLEMSQSIDVLPGAYLATQVAEKKIDLVRNYLELRRHIASSVLILACERADQSRMAYIRDAFIQMSRTAGFIRNIREAAKLELQAIHVAAQMTDARSFYLVLNTALHFFTVAREDVVVGLQLADLEAHSSKLLDLLRARDREGIFHYFDGPVRALDERVLAAVKAKYLQRKLEARGLVGQDVSYPSSDSGSEPLPQRTAAPAEIVAPVTHSTQEAPADVSQSPPETSAEPSRSEPTAAPEGAPPLARNDPDAWYPYFIIYYLQMFGCYPWENPDEIPPGPKSFKPG